MEIKKKTVPGIVEMKQQGQRIAALTAYDYTMASILDQSGIDLILVGDSAAMVIGGEETTIPLTMDQAVYHSRVVRRAVSRALLVADLPFLSYQTSVQDALYNAGRFFKEAGVDAVKLEGGNQVLDAVENMTAIGMPVMGHLGLTPQAVHKFGGYKVQANTEQAAEQLLADAIALEQAGVFSIVLEKIPASLAKKVTAELSIPTIGIGAGPDCDGQILVTHDMLGMYEKFQPKFVRRYAELAVEMKTAFQGYIRDVRSNSFPSERESY